MKQKIYIVSSGVEHEGGTIDKVFFDKGLAEQRKVYLEKEIGDFVDYIYIEEHEVER